MVKCVLINEKLGDIEEIDTPLRQDIYHILKGLGTFIGQYEDIDVVIMKCREPFVDLLPNQNKLPKPFDQEEVMGPILLIRMNENSQPEDFTLDEFTRYLV